MNKNRFKSYKPNKPYRVKKKSFSIRYLLLSILLGVVGGISALWLAMAFSSVVIDWQKVAQGFSGIFASTSIGTVTYYQSSKQTKTRVNNSPLPNSEESLDENLRRRRKNENYSDIHRYLN